VASSVAVHPTGRFAYAISGGVWGYTINASTGALTPIPGSPFADRDLKSAGAPLVGGLRFPQGVGTWANSSCFIFPV
jgi:hypothetical protein